MNRRIEVLQTSALPLGYRAEPELLQSFTSALRNIFRHFYTRFLHFLSVTQKTAKSGYDSTNITNLLRNRQSGGYYARVKVNGKQKWKALDTKLISIAKLRLPDGERRIRAQALETSGQVTS